ncbi:PIN domain-containing protein [Pseudanabaena sp. FACHB-1998]|uniref:PIN domain-containing protein n=1 Tax=Pseudanabaena sp. FACHB-1998 TaxID=2692858 RepID=UPI0016816552|nr:PIN domain-containing protein [Pseudanabaena sp. FACHB-1998]MBD2179234.1 PIN domain-containing protein [Pseudanabaena sp. FACHB-1998]
MTSKFTVIYDACVLYPNYLRDILIQLAIADLFRAKWTNLIHDEWIRNLIENRPDLPKEKLNQVKDLMNSQVRDSLVTDFEQLIPSLTLPDPNDRHILAAAIVAEADVIVTFNLKDFPDLNISQYGITAKHPDDFIADLIGLNPFKVMAAVETCRQRLKKQPKTSNEYLEILLKQGLPLSVSMLKELQNNQNTM